MTIQILEHPLVRKYFGIEGMDQGLQKFYKSENYHPDAVLAINVLDAMQQPIRKGERALQIYNCPVHEEVIAEDYVGFHPYLLRLPDQYQTPEKKECDHVGKGFASNAFEVRCMKCKQVVFAVPEPAPDKADVSHTQALEEKIEEIKKQLNYTNKGWEAAVEILVRDLVALARRQK